MTEKLPIYMPKLFVMDPETDDLLFDGKSLRNGMEVLIASDFLRKDPTDINLHPSELVFNRWTLVSNLSLRSFIDSYKQKQWLVEFIGTFDDGTKHKFSIGLVSAWYVKKHSIPAEDEERKRFLKMVADLKEHFDPMVHDVLDEFFSNGAPTIVKVHLPLAPEAKPHSCTNSKCGPDSHKDPMESPILHNCQAHGCYIHSVSHGPQHFFRSGMLIHSQSGPGGFPVHEADDGRQEDFETAKQRVEDYKHNGRTLHNCLKNGCFVGKFRTVHFNENREEIDPEVPKKYEVKKLHTCRDNGCTLGDDGPIHFNEEGDKLVGEPEYLSRLTAEGLAEMERQSKEPKKAREVGLAAKLHHEGADGCVVVTTETGFEDVHHGTCPQVPKTPVKDFDQQVNDLEPREGEKPL